MLKDTSTPQSSLYPSLQFPRNPWRLILINPVRTGSGSKDWWVNYLTLLNHVEPAACLHLMIGRERQPIRFVEIAKLREDWSVHLTASEIIAFY